jgi:hypothetical protein
MRLFMHPWEIGGYICVFGSYRKFLNNWNVEYHFSLWNNSWLETQI